MGLKEFGSTMSETIPLRDVPMPYERQASINSELVEVAGHELNHALIAKFYNIDVSKISVEKQSDSLGRTTFSGYVEPDVIKIIAAGGAVAIPDGPARGFGMDLRVVDYLHQNYGGDDKESAISKAGAILRGFDSNVRRKAAEIIAFKKEVSGDLLGKIIERAEFELSMINNQVKEVPAKDKENSGKTTIIEHLEDGNQRIIYTNNGRVDKEFFFCSTCKGLNEHRKDCSFIGQNRMVEFNNKDFVKVPKGEEVPLGKEGIFFDKSEMN